jgi:pimeloyl-ACP methyl ester carboxylesterase
MRFFAVALLATTAFGAVSAGRGEAPRPIIILVHGRGQLGQDTAALRRDWKRDLDSSLTLVGLPRLRDEDVRLAWYADVLDPDSEGECESRRPSSDSLSFADVARGFLGFLASAVPQDESREVRGLMADLLYVLEPSKQCDAERRVGSVIEAALGEHRPVIVVAYSLGSLVAYGYLESRPRNAKSPGDLRLVTIGSPLGVRVIRELVYGDTSDSLHVPTSIASWENVYDPNDFFSAPLEGVLAPRTVRDRPTHATEREDPHNLSRYLRDRATGAAVMRAICETQRKEIAACASF